MDTIQKLAELLKAESERSLSADVRLAAGAALGDDSLLWQSGERDFAVIAEGVAAGEGSSAVEIGCRVGRMLRAASKRFGRVIGVDMSERAINRARSLIGPDPRVELALSPDLSLGAVADASVDFVWSFSMLSILPPRAVASYVKEARRILKPNGALRLQLFVGEAISVSGPDLMHPRCYDLADVQKALSMAGFECITSSAVMPSLGTTLKDRGIDTVLFTARPRHVSTATADEIAVALVGHRELSASLNTGLPDIDTLATLDYASELAEEGEQERAKRILSYIDTCCRTAAIDIRDILDRVVAVVEQSAARHMEGGNAIFDANMSVLKERFPAVHDALSKISSTSTIRVTYTAQGPVIWRESMCLDHAEKPQQAAASWVPRALQEKRVEGAQHILVVGFGAGYHLEELQKLGNKKVSCFEPHGEALHAALTSRDLRSCLRHLSVLSLTAPTSRPFDESVEVLLRPQNALLDGEIVKPLQRELAMKRGLSTLHPRMAVLGPLQGGTIPTGYYTQGALQRLGQRSRGIDMSGFNKGFELLDQFVRSDLRRAAVRSSYVDTLCGALLENFDEKPIDILICMAQAPVSAKFLTEMRKRGVLTVLWFVEDYRRFTYWRDMAKFFDFVFTIQKGECIEAIRAAGAGEVHYLPTACDPFVHRPLELSVEDRIEWGSEVSFVGAGYHNRQQMFASLAHLPFKIWGSEWPTCRPFSDLVQQDSRRVSPEEYIKIFNASAINLNLHSSSERDGVEPNGDFINPRTFELAACGAFQLVDERTLLPECFEVGKEIVTFKSLPDLLEKIEFYRNNPEERCRIAERARARVLRDHTYDRRLEEMLGVIFASRFQQLQVREQNSPWSKMIDRSGSNSELKRRCEVACQRGEQPTLDALVADIVTGKGKLSETEQKLMFLFHVKKHILRPMQQKKEG